LLESIRRYGRSLQGTPVIGRLQGGRIQRVTVVGSLSTAGIGPLMTINGSLTGEAFLQYLADILLPSLHPGQTIVMDNLSAHKVSGVRQLIEAAQCHLRYLPPYSPDLNPIELAWAKMKHFLEGRSCASFVAFDTLLIDAVSTISQDHATAWIRKCGYRFISNI
jgi:transposase